MRGPDLPGHRASRHREEGRVGGKSLGLRRVQGSFAVRERAPHRSTEEGTECSAGASRHKVKLREGVERRMCLGKGIVAMCRRCKE
jgi:hypothetical protein